MKFFILPSVVLIRSGHPLVSALFKKNCECYERSIIAYPVKCFKKCSGMKNAVVKSATVAYNSNVGGKACREFEGGLMQNASDNLKCIFFLFLLNEIVSVENAVLSSVIASKSFPPKVIVRLFIFFFFFFLSTVLAT